MHDKNEYIVYILARLFRNNMIIFGQHYQLCFSIPKKKFTFSTPQERQDVLMPTVEAKR